MSHDDGLMSYPEKIFDPAVGVAEEDPEFDGLVARVADRLSAPVALVSIIDHANGRQVFKSAIGLPEPWATRKETPLSHSFCQHVVSAQDVLNIEDARLDHRVSDNAAIRDLGVIAYLGAPVFCPVGRCIGAICAIDHTPRSWAAHEIDEMSFMAEVVTRLIREKALAYAATAAQRQAESALAALDAANQRFHDLAKNVPGAILRYIAHADGRTGVEYMSAASADIWEVPASEIEHDASKLWAAVLPEDLAAMQASVQHSADTLTPWRHRWRIRTDSGVVKWLSGRGEPQRANDGDVLWNTLILDVTAEVKAEQAREAALVAAQEASHAKSLFLATMSHEIRTPMNGVTGMTALLASTDLDARQAEMVDVIKASGAAMLETVNTVLDYARMDVSDVCLEKAPFAVGPLAQEAVALCAARVDAGRLDVLLDLDPAAPAQMCGDAVKLRQLLINLLSNAVKFTDVGAVTLSISASDGAWRFDVADTGPGIAPDQLERIFEPFTQLDQSATRRHGGSGLGLSIARRLAHAMGGEITVASTLGRGSTFTLRVPL